MYIFYISSRISIARSSASDPTCWLMSLRTLGSKTTTWLLLCSLTALFHSRFNAVCQHSSRHILTATKCLSAFLPKKKFPAAALIMTIIGSHLGFVPELMFFPLTSLKFKPKSRNCQLKNVSSCDNGLLSSLGWVPYWKEFALCHNLNSSFH